MLPFTMPSPAIHVAIPWYTWLAVLALVLIYFGCLWTIVKLIFTGVTTCFNASWTGVAHLIQRLSQNPDTSYGTAHWATQREQVKAGVFNEHNLPLATSINGQI